MEITKREILVSIIGIVILLSIGLLINNAITYKSIAKKELYNKTLKIDNDKDTFKYAIDTNIGNVLVYGNFNIKNGVKIDELKQDYMAIKKETERYTKHTREVCNKCGEKTCCHTEDYYTWNTIDTKKEYVDTISFLNINFRFKQFSNYEYKRLNLNSDVVSDKHINKIRQNYIYDNNNFFTRVGDLRYKYYVVGKSFNGSVLAKAKNKTLEPINESKISIFHNTINKILEEIKKELTVIKVVFWIIYIILIGVGVGYFIYQDNYYLED